MELKKNSVLELLSDTSFKTGIVKEIMYRKYAAKPIYASNLELSGWKVVSLKIILNLI